jgi:hypothetical protein
LTLPLYEKVVSVALDYYSSDSILTKAILLIDSVAAAVTGDQIQMFSVHVGAIEALKAELDYTSDEEEWVEVQGLDPNANAGVGDN